MKKITMLLMSALIVVVLAACGMNKNTTKNDADENRAIENGGVNTTETERDRDLTNVDENPIDNDRVDNGVDHNGEARLDLAEDAADKVASLEEVNNATVILSNRNAYVAVVMEPNNEETDGKDEVPAALEDQIAEKVREVKKDVDNVYVSLNPDFAERMKGYGTRIQEGEPIEGFFDEFGEAVRNIFPDAR